MKTNLLSLMTVLALLFTSCQKEVSLQNDTANGNNNNPGGGGNNESIVGDWNFVGLTVQSNSTVEVAQPGVALRSVTVSDYASQNNSGSIKITTNEFSYTDISYTVNTVVNIKTYMNGALVNDTDQPFELPANPISNSTTYVKNDNDSITLKNAVFSLTDPSQGDPIDTGESGLKIAWAGDTLLLRMASPFSRTIENQGIPATLSGNFVGTMKLKRK